MIALAKCSQMSTYVPGFQSFFMFFASFCIGQISNQQHIGVIRVDPNTVLQSSRKLQYPSYSYPRLTADLGIKTLTS